MSFAFIANNTLEVDIKKDSEIIIKGTSSVNTFKCNYHHQIEVVENEITYKKNQASYLLENAKIALDANAFDCGGRRINSDFRELLDTENHPHIEIKIQQIKIKNNQVTADAKVNLAGKSKTYTFPIETPEENNFIGDLCINITDFGLEPPKKMMGLIVVDEIIDIEFNLYTEFDF